MTATHTPTPRQRQILDLLAAGKSNAEIAATLLISEHTVKVHLWRMYQAIGANSRTKAVAWWLAQQPDALAELRADRDELIELLRQCRQADLKTHTLTTGESLADAVSSALDKRSDT